MDWMNVDKNVFRNQNACKLTVNTLKNLGVHGSILSMIKSWIQFYSSNGFQYNQYKSIQKMKSATKKIRLTCRLSSYEVITCKILLRYIRICYKLDRLGSILFLKTLLFYFRAMKKELLFPGGNF